LNNNKKKKKELKYFIKKFNNTCPDCGKLFLGVIISGTYEKSMSPMDIGFDGYLSCGKCPECAKKCYELRHKILIRDNKLPCLDNKLDEYDNTDDFFMDLNFEIECYSCLDEMYIKDQIEFFHLDSNNFCINKKELVDLFEFFN
jgi:hypothetical protein